MVGRIEGILRSIRQAVSRSDWAIRLLRLSRLKEPSAEPGLVMVQIDGLSWTQFNKALKQRHVPFLGHLLSREGYTLHQFYSGLPSNTPSVQAELFYGIKGCVPSFSFIDQSTQKIIKMLDTSYVEVFEQTLKKNSSVHLLKGGSSYSNMYTGGAKEAHCCFGQLGWSGVLHAIHPFIFPFLLILYIDIFVRTFFLLIIEFVVALFECIRGILKGRILTEEFRFVGLRVAVCVFLRELIVAGACIDIMRGLPVIHLNFLGYDEQAHCRGPGSSFAHWALEGIDDSIERINNVIHQSPYRQYDLWVYSDHGQDETVPYMVKHHQTIEEAVKKLFGSTEVPAELHLSSQDHARYDSRVKLLKRKKTSKWENLPLADFSSQEAIVTAIGPVGQIYTKTKLDPNELDFFARQLTTTEVEIPLVLIRYQESKVKAYTKKGSFILPEEAACVFGENHPFLDDIKEDIIRACWHPNAGDFTIAGWAKNQESVSFPIEYGAHAGMSIEETRAFALLPMDAPLKENHKKYLRPMDLREAALNYLNKERLRKSESKEALKFLRIMSYNVHGCVGMDGQMSTERIARVIARHNPDVICLQELDALRKRSKGIDQAHKIAQYLEMKYHFHPVFCHEEEQYGNAILSRYPLTLIKMGALPQLKTSETYEPRGAMLVSLDFQGIKLNLINTHLSIWPHERILQLKALLSPEWLGKHDVPTVLCGDFNAMPGSKAYKKVCEKFKDSQRLLPNHRPYRTWFGRYPLSQIDHIFVTPQFKVNAAYVPHTSLDKVASDHLPLMVDLSFISS
jgi:endonuclease/exonuclease/phosphatase family metal-dependent hydrolase